MNNYLIAVKVDFTGRHKKGKKILPNGCAGFIFQIQEINVETAIAYALSETKSCLDLNEIGYAMMTSADLTP